MSDESRPSKARAIEKMVRQRAAAQEHYPLLDLVFENLALGMWSAVRRLLGEGAEVAWDASATMRFADYREAIGTSSVFGIFRIAEWGGEGAIAMDVQLVDAAVEALLGGGHGGSGHADGPPSGPREHTMVDRAIAGRFVRLALDELARAFARADQSIGPVTARLARLESDVRLLTVARRDELVARATFRVALGREERGGRFDLLLPHSTLEPVRRKLLGAGPSGRHHRDAPDRPLLAVLPEAPLTLHAVVDRLTLSLADIAQWREGTLLPLGVDAERPAILYGESEGSRSLGRKMFVGRLGASQGRKAVRILEVIPRAVDTLGKEALP
jgi:flagellar motor switch protein FliM